jgi:hypothetical protein
MVMNFSKKPHKKWIIDDKNREEWKKFQRMARNCRILHMALE